MALTRQGKHGRRPSKHCRPYLPGTCINAALARSDWSDRCVSSLDAALEYGDLLAKGGVPEHEAGSLRDRCVHQLEDPGHGRILTGAEDWSRLLGRNPTQTRERRTGF